MSGSGDDPRDRDRDRDAEHEAREEEAEALEVGHGPEAEALEAVELVIAGETDSRLRRLTALGIVVVSILAAIMVWRASVADEGAASAEHSAQQNLIQRQELLSSDEGQVFQEVRLFGRYEEHAHLARQLEREAGRSRGRATALLVDAQGERSIAREERPLFGQVAPEQRADGTVTYDAAYAREQQHVHDAELLNLRPPEQLRAEASAQHLKGVRLTGLAALFVAALVFLTLAEINRAWVARAFAGAGGVVAVVAFVLFLLV